MLNRKMNQMKKGGYTLFSDKTRKMMLAIGLSMLSVGVLGTTVNAAPTIEGEFKKTVNYQLDGEEDTLDTDITYQLKLTETGVGVHIDKLYTSTDGAVFTEVAEGNTLVWQANEDGNEVLAVVKVGADVTSIKVENDNGVGVEEAILTVSGAEETDAIEIDNESPEVRWMYKNVEENYIQFEATDNTKIYRVIDEDGEDRVNIEEKDQDTLITAKYELTDDDRTFYVCDMLGNKRAIDIETTQISYTIASKNADGKNVILNMTLPEGATLQSITTVEGIDITDSTTGVNKTEKGDANDSLVAVYTNVPEGTTFVTVTYELDGITYEFPVGLDLDLKAPVVVQHDIEGEGNIVKKDGVERVYKNTDATQAIVEVADFGSAITKIVACTGEGTEESPIVESTEENQVFDIGYLPTSVLQLIDLPEDATYIRIYDGIGNKKDISLDDVAQLEENYAGLYLELAGDRNGVTATIRDKKAGLEKIVRATAETAVDKEITASEGDISYIPTEGKYQTLRTAEDIAMFYPVIETTKELNVADLQGIPEITAVNVFGNVAHDSLNRILFHKDYVYVDVAADDDVDTTQYIAVKVSDARRIKKITAEIDGEEKVLEVFEIGTNGIGDGPTDVEKVYEIGNGATVTKVTVYHYNGDVTQNLIDIEAEDQITEDDLTNHVTITEDPADSGNYDITVTYGVRKVEYSDGCEIEFFEELPKTVNVYTKDKDGEDLEHVIVTDALGYTYDLMDETTREAYA